MIERITNPDKFRKVAQDIYNLFGEKDQDGFHQFFPHDIESIMSSYANSKVLLWDFFVWANLNTDGNYDAVISFMNHKSEKFAKKIFVEYAWISNNPKASFKLLAKALEFAKKQEFEYVSMSAVCKSDKFEKICNFYKKMGFVKDSETYVAKI
tara:strand:- start:4334 stop:4792 length:459 start_codon:yes stop_codon:yes gene_type:complete